MITLIELFDVTMFPIKEMKTGKAIDGKFVINNPDLKIKRLGFDCRSVDFTVEFEEEPENEE